MGIAHELITRGWTQGTLERDGAICLGKAAMLLDSGTSVALDTLRKLTGGDILGFNDDPRRTFDEVLRVAKEADELLGL